MEKGQQIVKTRKGYIGLVFMEVIDDFDINHIDGVRRKLD